MVRGPNHILVGQKMYLLLRTQPPCEGNGDVNLLGVDAQRLN